MTTPNDRTRRTRRTPTTPADPALDGLAVPDRSAAPDAEAALLGAALYYPRQAAQFLADLAPDDLADPVHRAVLTAIRAVLADGAPPEPALVLAAYNRGEHSNTPGNNFAVVVHDCLHHAGTPGADGHYRRAVLEARWRRDATAAAHRIHQAAQTAPLSDLHAVLAETLAHLGNTLARLALTPATRPTRTPAGTPRAETGTTAAPTTTARRAA